MKRETDKLRVRRRAWERPFLCLAVVFVGAVLSCTGCMSEVAQNEHGTTTRYHQPMLGPEIMRMLFGWPIGSAEPCRPAQ